MKIKNKTITQMLVMVLKRFLMENLIKNLKSSALSKNLMKSIKKYFIKNLIMNPKNGALSRNLQKLKMPYHKTEKNTMSKNIKNLKKCPIVSKKGILSKKASSRI